MFLRFSNIIVDQTSICPVTGRLRPARAMQCSLFPPSRLVSILNANHFSVPFQEFWVLVPASLPMGGGIQYTGTIECFKITVLVVSFLQPDDVLSWWQFSQMGVCVLVCRFVPSSASLSRIALVCRWSFMCICGWKYFYPGVTFSPPRS
jgi:hypothetical protein